MNFFGLSLLVVVTAMAFTLTYVEAAPSSKDSTHTTPDADSNSHSTESKEISIPRCVVHNHMYKKEWKCELTCGAGCMQGACGGFKSCTPQGDKYKCSCGGKSPSNTNDLGIILLCAIVLLLCIIVLAGLCLLKRYVG